MMKLRHNPMAAQDQLDMELMAEAELARLKRQFRIMEGDRKAFLDDISIKLSKQRKIILRLKHEKTNLLNDIKTSTCPNQKRKDTKTTRKLSKLLESHTEIVEKTVKQQAKLDEIETQIRKTEKQLDQLRLNHQTSIIPDSEYQFRIKSGQASIKVLENNLQTTTKRFCSVLTNNREMREEIDHLLKERTRFNAIWEQLVLDLHTGKKFMLDLVEQATAAYDQREEWCSKLQALKIRAHNDVVNHTQEMREMQRQLDHDGKLREFLTTKGQRRVMRDLELKEIKKRELEKESGELQLKLYQETLEKIREFCRETDIDRIAGKYLKQEEENFALFNYVNELNHELEELNENIKEFNEKISEYVEKSEERAQQQINTIDSLTSDLAKQKEQTKLDEKEMESVENELNVILAEIKALFDALKCDWAPILNLLGTKAEINEDNVFIYLGLLERKISGIITNIYFKEKSLMKRKKN